MDLPRLRFHRFHDESPGAWDIPGLEMERHVLDRTVDIEHSSVGVKSELGGDEVIRAADVETLGGLLDPKGPLGEVLPGKDRRHAVRDPVLDDLTVEIREQYSLMPNGLIFQLVPH